MESKRGGILKRSVSVKRQPTLKITLFQINAQLHTFVHIVVPLEVLVEIDMVAVHFFYQKAELAHRFVLGEYVEILALIIEVEVAGIHLGNQGIQRFIVHRESKRLAVASARVVQTLVVNPDFALADDKARFVVAHQLVFVQITDLAIVFKEVVGVFADFFNDIHTLLFYPVEGGGRNHRAFKGMELIVIVHRCTVAAVGTGDFIALAFHSEFLSALGTFVTEIF